MEGDLKAVERRPLVRFVDSAPVNFIDNLLAKADPKFGHINGSYDPASESYVTVADATLAGTSAVSTRDSQKSFELAIRSYLETRKGARVVFDFSKHHTWEHVLAEVKATQDEYQGVAAKGIIGHMRERLRSFGDRAGVVESWLKILPSASWQGSLVCGGIKIVLQAARQLGKMRTDICDAIEQIPETIANVQTMMNLYPQGGKLQAHASSLFVAIIDLLNHSLYWFKRNPILKFGAAILSGDEYGQKLQKRLSGMTSVVNRIDKQASIHQQQGQAENQRQTVEILNGVKELLVDREKNSRYQAEVDRLQRELAEGRRLYERTTQAQSQAITEDRKAFFLRLLPYSRTMALEDLHETLFVDPTVYDEAQDRVAYILQSQEVETWLNAPRSAALMINGGENDHSTVSATSLFTAMMVRSLSASKPGVVLYWFCGQRQDLSIQQMLSSLIGQLIDGSSKAIHMPNPSQFGRADNVRDLTRLLWLLIDEQLRRTSVYCILDAVSFYEDQYRTEDLCHVFDRVSALAYRVRRDSGNHLKLLVTSPTRASDVEESPGAKEAVVLNAPDEVEGSMFSLRETDVTLGVQRRVADQAHTAAPPTLAP